ncbi:MAG: ErfK/YbiS/YcfS/YnhG family protein, partial [Enterovirga sp.]|nr:ErfK/YbiS/YcfS/YnhG family protein [Enterovirga sp.]
ALPVGTSLKPGDRRETVVTLRQRLAASGDLAADAVTGDVFDETLAEAVRRFQARHGLPEGALVGARTVAALNVSAEARARQLTASAGRLMGSKFPFGERYVVVNIPAASVEAVQGGTVVRRYVAVVGKPDRASPQVETRITNINFNPTWTVPVSLIKKDIIPHMRKDPGYLAKMKIRILDGQGAEVDPATIDWSTEKAANYTLRQDPGADNSLGEIRIDMPNKLAVYMHDTPSKKLFARNTRAMSSGCVRVAGVRELAQWLLEGQPGPGGPGSAWGQAEIAAAIASGQRVDVKLTRHVPVIWTYLTGYATPDGTVHFRDDAYGLDGAVPAPAAPAPAGEMTIESLVTGALGERRT